MMATLLQKVARDETAGEIRSVKAFRKRVEVLTAKQRRAISRQLGTPPDLSRLTDEFWEDLLEKERAAYWLLFMAAGFPLIAPNVMGINRVYGRDAVSRQRVAERLSESAMESADWLAGRLQRTTRSEFERLFPRVTEDETVSPANRKREILDRVFPDSRIRTIATTEQVRAQSIGVRSVIDIGRENNLAVQEVWMLGKCKHCQVCPLLHKTERSFWGQVTPGAPLHPNCCCTIQMLVMTKKEAYRRGLLRRGNIDRVMAAMREAGFQVNSSNSFAMS